MKDRPTEVLDDAEQFGWWVQPSILAMNRLAVRLAPAADPHDIVQDALARAWVKRLHFDPARGNPTTWLLAIVADVARADRRRRHRWSVRLDDAAELPEAAGENFGVDVDLERAISQLPERQRLAVHCFYFLDLSVTGTAEVLGCAPGTVKSALFDARARLRNLLGDNDGN